MASRDTVGRYREAAERDAERWRRLEERAGKGELEDWELEAPELDGGDEERPAASKKNPKKKKDSTIQWATAAGIAGLLLWLSGRKG